MAKKIKAKGKIRKIKKQSKDPINLPEFDPIFSTILEYSKVKDPKEEWKIIREWLKEEPKTIIEMRACLQKAADVAVRARDLYLMARGEQSDFELRFKDRVQIWRVPAIKYWEKQKEKGMHKQITEAMIEDWIIENYSDLYLELCRRREEITAVKESLKNLAERVNSRGMDLRKLLESEVRRPSTPNWFDGKTSKGE
jgi:hypothetical protein